MDVLRWNMNPEAVIPLGFYAVLLSAAHRYR